MSDGSILLIEDARPEPGPAARALEKLRARNYAVAHAHTLAEGIARLATDKHAAAILDLALPGGRELPAFLRFQSKAGTVPRALRNRDPARRRRAGAGGALARRSGERSSDARPQGRRRSIEASCRWIARHQHANPHVDRWFLNLTRASFEDEDLADFIGETARANGVQPAHLGLEIEEQALGSCLPQVSELVHELGAQGFGFTLDGFGRGISSFAYLKSLPVSFVKLDYPAIMEGGGKRVGATLLRSLHQINRALGRATIMDSVGTREQLRELAAAGVDCAQGTAVGQPVALRRRRARAATAPTEH